MSVTRALSALALAAALFGGCTTPAAVSNAATQSGAATVQNHEKFEQDRAAILAMAGDYRVTFDFTETVSFVDGYELKDRYVTGGYESVRVIEDAGDFISLQHILVVGGEGGMPIKHWRQDWRYEPDTVLTFIGGNAWRKEAVTAGERAGKWSQTVYQVDDAPRYGAVAAWSHANGVSEWEPPSAWRPLPRRDATKRDDYHTIDAVNRHAITPDGWVHEQDNSKLILTGDQHLLVREVGVNTYAKSDEYNAAIADDYWAKTSAYWAGVRDMWTVMEASNDAFGLTIQGDPQELYMKLLTLADNVANGEQTTRDALPEARVIIGEYTTTEIGTLAERLGGGVRTASAY